MRKVNTRILHCGYRLIKHQNGQVAQSLGYLWDCQLGSQSTAAADMQVAVLSSTEKLETFLQRCGGGDGKAKAGAKSGASWGGCVLLFSDKQKTSPLYKSLAAQYAGKLAFGEVCHPQIDSAHIMSDREALRSSGSCCWP